MSPYTMGAGNEIGDPVAARSHWKTGKTNKNLGVLYPCFKWFGHLYYICFVSAPVFDILTRKYNYYSKYFTLSLHGTW